MRLKGILQSFTVRRVAELWLRSFGVGEVRGGTRRDDDDDDDEDDGWIRRSIVRVDAWTSACEARARERDRSFVHSFLGQSKLDFFFVSFADGARRSRRVSDEEVNDILSFFRIVHVLCGITSPWRTEETRFGPGCARGFVFSSSASRGCVSSDDKTLFGDLIVNDAWCR